jgi:hypothetical protein
MIELAPVVKINVELAKESVWSPLEVGDPAPSK